MTERPVETGPFDIDWRDLKAALEKNLSEATGVVHVRLEHAEAAETTFLRVLVERWLQPRWPDTSFTVVYVESSDAATRNVSGIARKLVSECNLTRRRAEPPVPPTVNILQGLHAEAIEICDNQIRVEVNGYADALSGEPLDDLRAGLASFLESQKLVLIVRDVAAFEPRNRADIGRELWQKCLARYRHSGVLLVCVWAAGDDQKVMDDAMFPPTSDVTIVLPTNLGDGDRDAAIGDVAEIAMRRGWSPDEQHARGFADGQVGLGGTTSLLHARLHIFESNWQRHQPRQEGGS